MFGFVLLVVLGCGPTSPAPSDTGTPSTSPTTPLTPTGSPTGSPTGDTAPADTGPVDTGSPETGDTGAPLSATGGCAPTSHPLVFECAFQLDPASPLTLSVTAPGASPRSFDSPRGTDHTLLAWGLEADTTYQWSAAGLTGTFTTGSLPAALSTLEVTREGTGSIVGADAVLVYVRCGYFVILEHDGDVVWFTETGVYDDFFDGMAWSQADRTVLAASDAVMGGGPGIFEERDLRGDVVLRLEQGVHFGMRTTHDVARWNDLTYLLVEDLPAGPPVGGFEVLRGDVKLGQWLITDDFTIPVGSHINGVTVTETGEVVLSDLISGSVIAVDGDPTSPTFLQRLWHASGGVHEALPDPDYAPATGILFLGQHNASRLGDELWVFDNQTVINNARAVRIAMDHATGTLTEIEHWSMGERCLNQSGAVPVPGGVLATCANTRWVRSFRNGVATPDWSMRAQCGTGTSLTRAFPVTIE